MNLLGAFGIQFAIFLFGLSYHYIQYRMTGNDWFADTISNKLLCVIILFIWFVLGTWLRYFLQMPIWGWYSFIK